MSIANIIQYTFSRGAITPLLLNRSDLDFYPKAASIIQNALVLPQGGIRNRWGTKYIDRLLGIAHDEIIATEYKYTHDKRFMVIFTDLNIAIYLDDVKQVDIVSPYTVEMIRNRTVKFVNFYDRLIIVGDGTIAPKQLQRGIDDITWTLTDIQFKNYPSFDFKKNYNDATFIINNPDNIGTVQHITSDIDLFDENYVGGLFYGLGDTDFQQEGIGRIVGILDPRTATILILQKFSTGFTTGIKGTECVLNEKAFNATYGYPTAITQYEGRLYFSSTPSLPSTIFGSVTNDPFNFDLGTGLDTDAIQVTLNGFYKIENIVGDVSLQVFTDEVEMATLQLEGQSLSPTTVSIRKQGDYGSNNITPVVGDNQTFFVKKGGYGVGAFTFDGTSSQYQSIPITLYADNLINNPICLEVYKGRKLDDSTYLFIVNSDGTLALYQTLQLEQISAFSSATLDGQNSPTAADTPKYGYVFTINDDLYMLVERVIEEQIYTYIEKVDFDNNFDCYKNYSFPTPTSVITDLEYLDGLRVQVKGDGYLLSTQIVENGQITIDRPSTDVTLGLWTPSYIRLLPFAVNLGNGNNMYEPKRINKLFVSYYATAESALLVNGYTFPEVAFYKNLPYPAPELLSGDYEITNVNGWEAREQLIIEQGSPYNFIILGVGISLGV